MFDNADSALRPGQFVNAHLLETVLLGATVVAKNVVQYDEQGPFAWLVQLTGAVEPRRIKVGPMTGEDVVIEKGLVPGDRIVSEGQFNLRAGERVAMKQATPTNTAADRSAISIP